MQAVLILWAQLLDELVLVHLHTHFCVIHHLEGEIIFPIKDPHFLKHM